LIKDGITRIANGMPELISRKDAKAKTFSRVSDIRPFARKSIHLVGLRRSLVRNAATQAELKIEQGKANVYLYQFNWATPLYGGKLGAFHTAEMPLAMRIVPYPEADELSKQMSAAYAAFARTGNPSHRGLPEWPAYTVAKRAVMFWDVPKCYVVNDPDSEERVFLRRFSMGGLL